MPKTTAPLFSLQASGKIGGHRRGLLRRKQAIIPLAQVPEHLRDRSIETVQIRLEVPFSISTPGIQQGITIGELMPGDIILSAQIQSPGLANDDCQAFLGDAAVGAYTNSWLNADLQTPDSAALIDPAIEVAQTSNSPQGWYVTRRTSLQLIVLSSAGTPTPATQFSGNLVILIDRRQ